MSYYTDKTYGRNIEVERLYTMFEAGRDVSMHGPQRLGKTFVLDRVVDASASRGWVALKVEIGGCTDSRAVFRELCARIGTKRSGGKRALTWVSQRLGQVFEPRNDPTGQWYQPFLTLDHETYFGRLLQAMHDDPNHKWVLLIDELPIFLKALHDKDRDGVAMARAFMNMTSQLRQKYPRVRWMITGSIGIEPLAQTGNYMGVLAKFDNFVLAPLEVEQAKDFLQDIAQEGRLLDRKEITDAEAQEIITTVGWRAAYYLDAVAQKLRGTPQYEITSAGKAVQDAVMRLLEHSEMATFGTWEEHLRKHFNDTDRAIALISLGVLANKAEGSDMDGLLGAVQRPEIMREKLRSVLIRLDADGFVAVNNWALDSPTFTFRNPLLRRWWNHYKPSSHS